MLTGSDSVPVIDIITRVPELTGPKVHEYETIRYEDSCKLAQRLGAYIIVQTRRPVVRHKPTQTLNTAPAADAIRHRSIADVICLIPRLWENTFGKNPARPIVDVVVSTTS